MKKKKIKKGIILLSLIMIIINTILPTISKAAEYTTGNVLYEIYNGDSAIGQQAYLYIKENMDMLNENHVKFISLQLEENSEIRYPIRITILSQKSLTLYMSAASPDPILKLDNEGRNITYVSGSETTVPYKITVYEIIEFVPTPVPTATPVPTPVPTPSPTPVPTPSPTPSPTPDERVTNLLNETGNGVGTILTWVGDLWKGITTGDMSAILPIFVIFIAIPLILLVIKIIKKTTWGD